MFGFFITTAINLNLYIDIIVVWRLFCSAKNNPIFTEVCDFSFDTMRFKVTLQTDFAWCIWNWASACTSHNFGWLGQNIGNCSFVVFTLSTAIGVDFPWVLFLYSNCCRCRLDVGVPVAFILNLMKTINDCFIEEIFEQVTFITFYKNQSEVWFWSVYYQNYHIPASVKIGLFLSLQNNRRHTSFK